MNHTKAAVAGRFYQAKDGFTIHHIIDDFLFKRVELTSPARVIDPEGRLALIGNKDRTYYERNRDAIREAQKLYRAGPQREKILARQRAKYYLDKAK